MLKSYTSAVVIIPPKYVWDQIQTIRRKYDRVFNRWMPHINLVYPFKSDTEFSELVPALRKELSQIEPFTISFTKDSFGFFDHGGMWLKPLLYSEQVANLEAEKLKIQSKVKISTKQTPNQPSISWKPLTPKKKPGIAGSDVDQSSKYPSPPSLSNLKDAIWQPEDNDKEMIVSGVGLHNLKHAFWKPGDKDLTSVFTLDMKTISYGEQNQRSDKCETEVVYGGEMEVDEEERDPDVESDNFSMVSRTSLRTTENQVKTSKFHPSVMEIQQLLQQMYPDFNDLSSIDEHGYYPHLTLGQFKKQEIDKMMTEFKENWSPIDFKVDEIYLISRQGPKGPFEIREQISLG